MTSKDNTFRPVATKYGLKSDYVGAHVLTSDGRLAEIKRTYSEDLPAGMGWVFKSDLYHFNGEFLGTVETMSLRILDKSAV